ncbi:MAG: hypothetical protein HYZ63_00565 [Candidatus Andersenbacteria bacterium]|nr:hypothetical protein [Candidatus Andersenbacteria bacterium]
MTLALVLILFGVAFFAKTLGFISMDTLNVLWPLLLVVLGLSMVSHHWFGHRCNDKECWRCAEISFENKPKKKR